MTTTFIFANNATTTLAAPCSAVATTVTVSPGSGALFPSPTSGQSFAFCLVDAATGNRHEIMYCTSRAGDVLTVTRAQEGTVAQDWLVGDFGSNFITAGNAASFAQNISGAVVYLGTWNAATNTPALASGTGVAGTYYIVSVSGTTDLDGENIWAVGDWATFNGVTWERILGSANEVFNGLTVNTLTGLMYANGSSPVTAVTTVSAANGGTGISSPTLNALLIGNGSSAMTELPAGAAGTIPYFDGTDWQTGIPASLVGSFSAGFTGLTPNVPTSGPITLAGTLNTSSGGTGDSGTISGLVYGNGASAMTAATSAEILAEIGTVSVNNGGTGNAGTLTGIVYGNGASPMTVATSGEILTQIGTIGIANGGTGQTTQQTAINALAGATTSGQYLRGDGTNVSMSAIQAADVPTLNQNTTGSAGSIANTGGWNITPTGTKIYFNYNGTDVASLDSSGNLIVLGDITSQSAP